MKGKSSLTFLFFITLLATSQSRANTFSCDAVLNELAQLTVEYHEVSASNASSEIMLKALKHKFSEFEAVMDKAGKTEEEKQTIKLRLSNLIRELSGAEQVQIIEATSNEDEARQNEKGLAVNFEEDTDSELSKVFRAEAAEHTTGDGWASLAADGRHLIFFHRYEKKAVVFDLETGRIVKTLHTSGNDGHEGDHLMLRLSTDRKHIQFSYEGGDAQEIYSISLKKLLASPFSDVFLRKEEYKRWTSHNEFMLRTKTILTGNRKLFIAAEAIAGQSVLLNLKDLSTEVTYMIPPDILKRDFDPKKETSMHKAIISDDGKYLCFYTFKSLVIFNFKTGKYMGRLDASPKQIGGKDDNAWLEHAIFSPDSKTVIATHARGIVTWSLDELKSRGGNMVPTSVTPFKAGHSMLSVGLKIVISPDGKNIAVGTSDRLGDAYYIDIFRRYDDGHIQFVKSLTTEKSMFDSTQDVMALAFSQSSDRLFAILINKRLGPNTAKVFEVAPHFTEGQR